VSEAIVGVVAEVAPVLQILPELHVLCEEPTLPMSMVHQMVDSAEASVVSLPPTPQLLEPSQTLAFVEREGVDDIVVPSKESIGQVVHVDGDVVTSNIVAPIPELFLPKKKSLSTFSFAWRLMTLDLARRLGDF
jgi:hypothetical protein